MAKKPVAKKPTKKAAPKKKKAAPKNKPARVARKAARVVVSAPVPLGDKLGEIVVPSGKLAVFDIGLVGFLRRDALEPAIVIADVPTTPLPVYARKVGKGRYAEFFEAVVVPLGPGEATHGKKLGEAGVDFARLILMDHAALDHWRHDDALDGKADVVFWGRDAAKLAPIVRAPKLDKAEYGWADLPVAEAEAKLDAVHKAKAANKFLLATDYRPHSHHFQILAEARRSAAGVGTLELAGSHALMFFIPWGDGVYPVYLDLDAKDRPVALRIQLYFASETSPA